MLPISHKPPAPDINWWRQASKSRAAKKVPLPTHAMGVDGMRENTHQLHVENKNL